MDLARGQHVLRPGTSHRPGRSRSAGDRRLRRRCRCTGDRAWRCWPRATSWSSRTQTPPPGSVRDSNRFALMAAAEDAGAEVVWQAHAVDDEAALERAMRDGAGRGRRADHLGRRVDGHARPDQAAARAHGDHSVRARVVQTGQAADLCHDGRRQAGFGCPGFPVSSLVTFEVFVRPALLKLGGADAGLAAAGRGGAGPRRFGRTRSGPSISARPSPGRTITSSRARPGLQASSRLMSIVGANALLEIASGQRNAARGHNGPGASARKPIIRRQT